MTTTAQSLLYKAQTLLLDETGVRWSDDELLGWLNDGQKEIAQARPDLFTVTGNITCVEGTRQSIPAGATKLLRVTRNMGLDGATPGRAIRPASMALLDASVPNWHSRTPSAEITNMVTDSASPRVFYVCPPAVAGTRLEAEWGTSSVDVPAATGDITVDDTFGPALVDYMCFRAYSKDQDLGGATQRAAAHYQLFKSALATRAGADSVTPPEAGG